jgi:peptidoglycan/LPS O-acetylase OafA/YrhL
VNPGSNPTVNNFDLIRLLAATQVMLKHALLHLGYEGPGIELLGLFPGVPVFFFISGFLIFQSYRNSRSIGQFALNRVLRIYPGLLLCFAVSIALVLSTGYLQWRQLGQADFLLWALAQSSLLQIYNAEFMRGFGVGVLNGSLWTIAVELQFYLLTPLLGWVVLGRRWVWPVVLLLGVFANLLLSLGTGNFLLKLFSVSSPPWFYMFALGAWLSQHEDWQRRLLALPSTAPLIAYLLTAATLHALGLQVLGNEINPLSFLLLAALVFRLAYTQPGLSDRLLHRNDISYGVYIYHMPVINLLLFHGLHHSAGSVVLASAATLAAAWLSWRYVERPALRLKRLALRPL